MIELMEVILSMLVGIPMVVFLYFDSDSTTDFFFNTLRINSALIVAQFTAFFVLWVDEYSEDPD